MRPPAGAPVIAEYPKSLLADDLFVARFTTERQGQDVAHRDACWHEPAPPLLSVLRRHHGVHHRRWHRLRQETQREAIRGLQPENAQSRRYSSPHVVVGKRDVGG